MSEADIEHVLEARLERAHPHHQYLQQQYHTQMDAAVRASLAPAHHAAGEEGKEETFCTCNDGCHCKMACEYRALTSDESQQQCACRSIQNRTTRHNEQSYEYDHPRLNTDASAEPAYMYQHSPGPRQDSSSPNDNRTMPNHASSELSAYPQRPVRGRSNTESSDLAYIPDRSLRRKGGKDAIPLDFYSDSSRYPTFRQTLPSQMTATNYSSSPPCEAFYGSRPPLYHAQSAAPAISQTSDTNTQLLFGSSPAVPRPQMVPRYVSAGGSKRLSQRSELKFDLPSAHLAGFEMNKDELFRNLPPATVTPRTSSEQDGVQAPRSRAGSATAVKQALKRVFSRSSSSAHD